jgi:AcrR family transcriptional regulator
MQEAADLRVQKTREAIQDAFLALVGEKGFNGVTVHELCLRARINRSTFYLHYTDKYDLLDKITRKATGKILRLVSPAAIVGEDGKVRMPYFQAMVLSLFRSILEDRVLYKTLLGINGDYGFLQNLEAVVKEKIVQEWHNRHLGRGRPPIAEGLYINIILSIYVGAILWWIDGDFALTPEEMTTQITRYMIYGTSLVADFKPLPENECSVFYDTADSLAGKGKKIKNN